jgi:mannitol-1-/sugar-/sorbitol-6-phosphatase
VISYPCRAVLFDCDGVLVDSDASVISAWSRWAVDRGLDPHEVTSIVHGRRSADTVELLIEPEHRRAALAQIDRYEVENARSVRAIPGARALVDAIPRERWAVVTSGTTALARARLSAAGLPIPAVLVSADDVEHGKPHPAGYLSAAHRLGVPVGSSVVLEDALAGIRAARAAGVAAVVGDRGLDTDSDLVVADVVVADLAQVRWTGNALQLDL